MHSEATNKFLKIGVYNGITYKDKLFRAVILASTSLILFLNLHYFLVRAEKPLVS